MPRTSRPPPDSYTETKGRPGSGGVPERGFGLLVSCASGVYVLPLGVGREFVIGRVPECDVVVADASVSRQHARLSLGDAMTLEDLGSSNGTTVQGRPVARGERTSITVGTVFELGAATFVLQRAATLPAGGNGPTSAAVRATSRHSVLPVGAEVVVNDVTMRNLYALLEVVAPSPLSVLVLGETGVGKEVYAEAVHKRSARCDKPFLQLNCAALPESILEAELFGYEKGAFTGAVQAKAGLFESADNGTVFLDEVGEIPMTTQAKLLRVIESGQVMRLGSVKPKIVDVRFVAATNRDPRQLIAEGKFRADLYFRLNGISITLPPLRNRKADIAPLARYLVERMTSPLGKPEMRLTDEAIQAIERHDWPGNVRELRNVMERAVVMCRGTSLGLEDLVRADPEAFGVARTAPTPPEPQMTSAAPAREPVPLGTTIPRAFGEPERLASIEGLRGEITALERDRILDALAKCAGNQSSAAKMLQISRYTLMARIERHGLARPRKGRA